MPLMTDRSFKFCLTIGRSSKQPMWLRKAADRGVAHAQENLGFMYANAQGVQQDYALAAKWYRLAADQDDGIAQSKLGVMYAMGLGVPQNYTEAVKWLRKAVEQSDLQAEYNLGFAYETGRGVPQNDAEAVVWFRKAAEQGSASAENKVDKLSRRLPFEQSPAMDEVLRAQSAYPDFEVMEAETGCKSKYSEQKKVDLFAANYKGKQITATGEVVGLPKGVINLKMFPSTQTMDLSVTMRDPQGV
jgi:hypothetical protein